MILSREERYTLPNATGYVTLRYPGCGYGLFVGGKPIAFNYDDNHGSIGQEIYYFSELSDGIVADPLQQIVLSPPNERPLAETLYPLLRQLPPGEGSLLLEQIRCTGYWEREQTIIEFYPFSEDAPWLIPTQPEETLDPARWLFYLDFIANGGRPWAITIKAGHWCEYILDGHHKLKAYEELDIPALRLRITPPNRHSLAKSDWPPEVPMVRSWKRCSY